MLTIKERKANRRRRLRIILCDKDYTQKHAAEKIGVHQSTISRILDDPGKLTIEQAYRLGMSDTDICRLKNGI